MPFVDVCYFMATMPQCWHMGKLVIQASWSITTYSKWYEEGRGEEGRGGKKNEGDEMTRPDQILLLASKLKNLKENERKTREITLLLPFKMRFKILFSNISSIHFLPSLITCFMWSTVN
jgi:hypothetical protein